MLWNRCVHKLRLKVNWWQKLYKTVCVQKWHILVVCFGATYSKVFAVFLHLASTNFVGRQYNTWCGKNKARNDEPRNIISDRNICSYSAAPLRVLAAVDWDVSTEGKLLLISLNFFPSHLLGSLGARSTFENRWKNGPCSSDKKRLVRASKASVSKLSLVNGARLQQQPCP